MSKEWISNSNKFEEPEEECHDLFEQEIDEDSEDTLKEYVKLLRLLGTP